MTLEGRQLRNFVIGRRATEKARAPLLTPARNALKKGAAKLVKRHGGDSGMVSEHFDGPYANGLEALQRGKAVTLRMTHCLRSPSNFFDAGEYEIQGEIVVTLASPIHGSTKKST